MAKLPLHKDDLEYWKEHPITKVLLESLKEVRNNSGKELEGLMYQSYRSQIDKDKLYGRIMVIAGRNETIDRILDLKLLDSKIEWEQDNAESNRISRPSKD